MIRLLLLVSIASCILLGADCQQRPNPTPFGGNTPQPGPTPAPSPPPSPVPTPDPDPDPFHPTPVPEPEPHPNPNPAPEVPGHGTKPEPAKPLVAIEKIKSAYSVAEINQIETNLLARLAGYNGVLDAPHIRLIRETIQLISLIAKNEAQIVQRAQNNFIAGGSAGNVVTAMSQFVANQFSMSGFVVGNNPPFLDTVEMAGFPPNFPIQTKFEDIQPHVETLIRENFFLLALGLEYLNVFPNGQRDFFQNGFDDTYGCIAARGQTLRAFVNTRVLGKSHSDAMFAMLTQFPHPPHVVPNDDPTMRPPSFDFYQRANLIYHKNSTNLRLFGYFRNNVVFRPMLEKPANDKKTNVDLMNLPEYASTLTLEIATNWIFNTVRQTYQERKKVNLWNASEFASKKKVCQRLNADAFWEDDSLCNEY